MIDTSLWTEFKSNLRLFFNKLCKEVLKGVVPSRYNWLVGAGVRHINNSKMPLLSCKFLTPIRPSNDFLPYNNKFLLMSV